MKRVEGTDFVYVEVTGKELPSLKFSPELSFEASVTKPQLNGGVSLLIV